MARWARQEHQLVRWWAGRAFTLFLNPTVASQSKARPGPIIRLKWNHPTVQTAPPTRYFSVFQNLAAKQREDTASKPSPNVVLHKCSRRPQSSSPARRPDPRAAPAGRFPQRPIGFPEPHREAAGDRRGQSRRPGRRASRLGEVPGAKGGEEGGAGEARPEHVECGRSNPGQLRFRGPHEEGRGSGRDLAPDAHRWLLRRLLHQVRASFFVAVLVISETCLASSHRSRERAVELDEWNDWRLVCFGVEYVINVTYFYCVVPRKMFSWTKI